MGPRVASRPTPPGSQAAASLDVDVIAQSLDGLTHETSTQALDAVHQCGCAALTHIHAHYAHMKSRSIGAFRLQSLARAVSLSGEKLISIGLSFEDNRRKWLKNS